MDKACTRIEKDYGPGPNGRLRTYFSVHEGVGDLTDFPERTSDLTAQVMVDGGSSGELVSVKFLDWDGKTFGTVIEPETARALGEALIACADDLARERDEEGHYRGLEFKDIKAKYYDPVCLPEEEETP